MLCVSLPKRGAWRARIAQSTRRECGTELCAPDEAGRESRAHPGKLPGLQRGPGRSEGEGQGKGARTWKCWKKAEIRVICRLRHLEAQRAR